MKKFTAILLIFLYAFFGSAQAFANQLYYITNAEKSKVLNIVQNTFNQNGYTIKNADPVYGVYGSTEAVSIIQPTGSDLYYYFDAPEDTKLNSIILQALKNNGYSYKKYKNDSILLSMAREEESLKKSLSQSSKKYEFNDTTTYTTNSNKTSKYNFIDEDDPNALTGYVAQIPVGTTIDVYLQTTVNTASAAKGDEVVAVLTKNWEYDGHVIAGQGSTVYGRVSKAKSAGIAYRDGYVKFDFNTLKTVEGKTYNIVTDSIEFKVASTGKATDAAAKIAGRAAIGAIMGLLVGVLSKDANIGTATAIGAGAGAAWGAGSAVFEQGTDAEIPTYTEMELTLTSPLTVIFSN